MTIFISNEYIYIIYKEFISYFKLLKEKPSKEFLIDIRVKIYQYN